MTRSALPRIGLLALIWGSAFLWIKLADRGFSPVEVTLARLALGAAVLAGRPEGHRLLWSQIHGLGADMVISWLEGAPRDDVDTDAKELLEILEQADMIKKGSTRLKIHEQIYIAARASLAPRDRAEHRDTMSPAPPRDAEDLLAAAAQPFDGQHVIGHPLRVSPCGWPGSLTLQVTCCSMFVRPAPAR